MITKRTVSVMSIYILKQKITFYKNVFVLKNKKKNLRPEHKLITIHMIEYVIIAFLVKFFN